MLSSRRCLCLYLPEFIGSAVKTLTVNKCYPRPNILNGRDAISERRL